MSEASRPRRRGRSVFRTVAVALTLALFVVVGTGVGWRSIAAAVAAADVRFILAAWGLAALLRLADALQLFCVLRRADLQITYGRVLMANASSTLFGFLLPGDLGAAVAKWSTLAAATGTRAGSLNAILYNRALVTGSALLVGAVALAAAPPPGHGVVAALLIAVLLVLFLAVAAVSLERLGDLAERALLGVSQRLLTDRIAGPIASLLVATRPLRSLGWTVHLRLFLAAISLMLLRAVVLLLLALSLGYSGPFLVLVWTKALLSIVRQLPISFHGIGVRETTLVGVLGLYGVSASTAFSLGLLGFVSTLLFAAFGLLCHLAFLAGLVSWRPQEARPNPMEGE